MSAPVPVTVFSDYICPFCYVGDARLKALAREVELQVEWCFLEIHPENPEEGMPVEDLGYPPEVWARMMESLTRMAAEEGLPLAERTFTTNSRRALLLAEAARATRPDAFPALHDGLFAAYFRDGRNIADEAVLREVAQAAGLDREWFDGVRDQPVHDRALQDQRFRSEALGITGVPAFLFGRYLVSGAVPRETLRRAAALAAAGDDGGGE